MNMEITEIETFYAIMNRLRQFLMNIWESDEEISTIISHISIMNILNLMLLQVHLEKFWEKKKSSCCVSKVQIYTFYSFDVGFWNSKEFLRLDEKNI